jgi:hypothetical protein
VARLHITVLEGAHQGEAVEAQFNPKEISVERTAVSQSPQTTGAPALLQFVRLDRARMAFELVFDGVKASASVQPHLDPLRRLTSLDSPPHRPAKVRISCGTAAGVMSPFEGVVASLAVTYLTFGPSGVPPRATASLMLVESATLEADGRRA